MVQLHALCVYSGRIDTAVINTTNISPVLKPDKTEFFGIKATEYSHQNSSLYSLLLLLLLF
jgi:hypothetical protein